MQYRSILFFLLIATWLFVSTKAIVVHANQSSGTNIFLRDLRQGSRGDDVKKLQEYLNSHGTPIANSGPGSSGNETTYYGPATRAAIARFQESHTKEILFSLNLTKGTGNFYASTRAFINSFLVSQKSMSSVPVLPDTSGQTGYHTIGGDITGVEALTTIYNNDDTIQVTPHDTAHFVFPKKLSDGDAYVVKADTSLFAKLYCHVSPNGTGVVSGVDIGDIKIMCDHDPFSNPFLQPFTGGGRSSPATYTIGGTVSNLSGTLVLQNNSGDNLSLISNGSFSFNTHLLNGSSYSVTILTNPTSPSQICSVSGGQGSVSRRNISSVSVTCLTVPTITLGNITKTYGDSPFAVTATSTSDGSITYTSSNHSVATVSGTMVTIIGAGTATISALQATSSYHTAISTTTLLTVNKATPVISAISDLSFDSADYVGLCLVDHDAFIAACDSDGSYLRSFPTSTSNAPFTTLYASNSDVVNTSTDWVDYAGFTNIAARFNFNFAFSITFPFIAGPITTTATLYQSSNANYTDASTTFNITITPVSSHPDSLLSCLNNGILIRITNAYSCACPSQFTGAQCQAPILEEA